jgi:hypothetical protein
MFPYWHPLVPEPGPLVTVEEAALSPYDLIMRAARGTGA